MKAIKEMIGKVADAKYFYLILPLPLIIVPLLWILAFYLGVDDRQAAYFLTLGLRGCLAMFFFVLGLCLVIEEKECGPIRITLFLVLGFFAACFSFAVVVHGLHPMIRKTAGQFLLSALPALMAGIYCAKKRSGDDLLRGIEWIGLILLPAAIIYVWRFFVFTDEIYTFDLRRLGRIDYMSLAYGFIPLMVASCILLFEEKTSRRLGAGRWLLVSVYWLAIVFSQTRGAVLGVFLFLVVLAIFKIKEHKKRVLILALLCTVIFVGSLSVLPKLFGDGSFRFSAANVDEAFNFAGGATKFAGGATKFADTPGRQFLLANEDNGVFIDQYNNLCTIHNKEIAQSISLDEGLYESIRDSGCTIKLSRMSLLVTSIEEIKKSPWFGMGPLAYQLRYFGFHPHNLFIELLVELGVVLGGLIVVGLICMGGFFLLSIKRGTTDQHVLLLAVVHIPMFMVSGTIWGDAAFSFFLGYLFVLVFWGQFNKKANVSQAFEVA